MVRRLRLTLALVLSLAGIAACTNDDPVVRRPGPTTTVDPAAETTDAPAPEAETTTSAPPPTVPARVDPRPDRPSYRMAVDVRLDEGVVVGEQTVRFIPDLDTDRMVFRLWANSPRITRAGGGIEVALDGASQPDPTTLVLPRALRAGEATEVSMTWRLTLPTNPTNDRIARAGDSVRLGSFFPILSWHPGLGWATEPPTSGFAEASISLPADFDVTFTAPPHVKVLATGVNDTPNHWVASGVPDWAASVGDLRIVSATADSGGAQVQVSVGVDRQVGDRPEPYLVKVVDVLADFGRRFGPYPWPTFTLALSPALPGGIEYPMHVMQGPGTLGRTTSHEVGHMWFYGLVASNQGATPWIDEGLATYAEARYENSLAEIASRPIPPEGRGRAGEPMTYWESRQSAYYRSIYVQGAQAVAALGAADLVDCALRQLVARYAYRTVGNGEVVASLSTVFPDAGAVLARYGIRT